MYKFLFLLPIFVVCKFCINNNSYNIFLLIIKIYLMLRYIGRGLMGQPKTTSVLIALVVILFFAFWEGIVRLNLVDPYSLAAPTDSLVSLFNLPELWPNLTRTLFFIGLSYLFAVSIGLLFGLIVGSKRLLMQISDPFVMALYSTPKVILMPIFILWIGLGFNLSVVFATFSGFFPMAINTIAALKGMSPSLLLLPRSLGASRFQTYRKVIFPALLPMISTGLRLSLIAVMIAVILVEFFVPGFGGVGGLMVDFSITFRVHELYGVIILMSVIAIAIVMPILFIEKRLSKWRL